MKFNHKAEEVLKAADDNAIAAGLKSYGLPHIILALMDTRDFQSAYTGNYETLREIVKAFAKIYAFPAVSGLMGYDAESVLNILLPDVYKRMSSFLKTDEIILAHLFWALCAECDSINMETSYEKSSPN